MFLFSTHHQHTTSPPSYKVNVDPSHYLTLLHHTHHPYSQQTSARPDNALRCRLRTPKLTHHTHAHTLTTMTTVHPVLNLINRCDTLAQQFDTTFSASCTLLTNMSNGMVSPSGPQTMDNTLTVLRSTLDQCEGVVGEMLGCIYADIPHLLDQLDRGEEEVGEGGKVVVGNWNPKQALDGISQLFYVRFSPRTLKDTVDAFCTHLTYPLLLLLFLPLLLLLLLSPTRSRFFFHIDSIPAFRLTRASGATPKKPVLPRPSNRKTRTTRRLHMRRNLPHRLYPPLDLH